LEFYCCEAGTFESPTVEKTTCACDHPGGSYNALSSDKWIRNLQSLGADTYRCSDGTYDHCYGNSQTCYPEDPFVRGSDNGCKTMPCLTFNIGSNNAGESDIQFDVPEGYVCPSSVTKDNWLNTETYDDTFTVKKFGSTYMVSRDGPEKGWGLDLKFDCCEEVAPTCVEVPVGSNDAGNFNKIVTVPAEYRCPEQVNKDNWFNPENYGDSFTVSKAGEERLETQDWLITRDGWEDVNDHNNGWGMPLLIKCCTW